MTRCFIGIGGNLGPVADTFRQALELLDAAPQAKVSRVSGFFHTRAIGSDSGPEYLNAAAEIQTDLAPLPMLELLQTIEHRLGRRRQARWEPRPIDLDLLLDGNGIVDLPRLQVPHPGCWYRRFVLDPLAEIAVDVVHPLKQLTIGQLRERLLPRPLRVCLAGGVIHVRKQLIETLKSHFPPVELLEWDPRTESDRISDDSLVLVLWLGAGDTGVRFEELPRIPRIDVSATPSEPIDAVFAALGE